MKIEPTTIEPTAQQLTSEQIRMLRWASRPTGTSPPFAPLSAAAVARSGSSTKRQIRKGQDQARDAGDEERGVPVVERGDPHQQPGASAVPTIGPKTFWTMPALSAWRP
jgi:hypothetical protein